MRMCIWINLFNPDLQKSQCTCANGWNADVCAHTIIYQQCCLKWRNASPWNHEFSSMFHYIFNSSLSNRGMDDKNVSSHRRLRYTLSNGIVSSRNSSYVWNMLDINTKPWPHCTIVSAVDQGNLSRNIISEVSLFSYVILQPSNVISWRRNNIHMELQDEI